MTNTNKAMDNTQPANDGRKARSQKSREEIKKALYDLMNEGVRIPTAQQVSDKAGVGIRTVFRHFDDMESLFFAIHEDLKEQEYETLMNSLIDGSLEDRVEALLQARNMIFTKYREVILSTLSQLWKYSVLKETYKDLNNIFRIYLFKSMPELKTKDEETKQIVEALASFEAWNRLTRHQGLSKDAAIAIMKKQILNNLK